MNIINRIMSGFRPAPEPEYFIDESPDPLDQLANVATKSPAKNPRMDASFAFGVTPAFHIPFDGEKTAGELGSVRIYHPQHWTLSQRAWQSFLDNPITQLTIQKYVDTVTDGGLKIQAEPVRDLIGQDFDDKRFKKDVEMNWSLMADSKFMHISGVWSLHELAKQLETTALLNGDCLVVLRIISQRLVVELIDTARLKTPQPSDKTGNQKPKDGNEIKHGVEIDKDGNHVAYWVINEDRTFTRIITEGPRTKVRIAWLYYGKTWKIGHTRGIPLITAIMERLATLDRYTEAIVGKAEEIAKNVFQVTHDENSQGTNPFSKNITSNFGFGPALESKDSVAGDVFHNHQNVARTTKKTTFNMPVGAKIETVDHGDGTLEFEPFFMPMFGVLCATIQIPPEVALMKYGSNYSASRAAIIDWQRVVERRRKFMAVNFYRPVFAEWLFLEGRLGNINQLDAYVTAREKGNIRIRLAFEKSRFIGSPAPQIDPVKEVTAARLKLGKNADGVPIGDMDQMAEDLGLGEWMENIQRFTEQWNEVPENLRTSPSSSPTAPPPTEGNREDDD